MSEVLSFERDIRPLFTDDERVAMEGWFDLFDFDDVRERADVILERLEDGSMPCDEPWPEEDVARFRQWMKGGKAP